MVVFARTLNGLVMSAHPTGLRRHGGRESGPGGRAGALQAVAGEEVCEVGEAEVEQRTGSGPGEAHSKNVPRRWRLEAGRRQHCRDAPAQLQQSRRVMAVYGHRNQVPRFNLQTTIIY